MKTLGIARLDVGEFDYDLPERLIAQVPSAERADARLLLVDRKTGKLVDRSFGDLLECLAPGDLLVMNNTRVMKARLVGKKPTGARVELLVEQIQSTYQASAMARSNKPLKIGQSVIVGQDELRIVGRRPPFVDVQFPRPVLDVLQSSGQTPLPPYIQRPVDAHDDTRYQTVYASELGAAAAPTAGLHIDQEFLLRAKEKAVGTAFITLHVGAGTFRPMRTDRVEEHKMHAEHIVVSAEVCDAVAATRAAGGRVVAVGTTTVRALESATNDGVLEPSEGPTSIFIYPGYQFRSVDSLVTNFHLPKSTLMMLVSAFASRDIIMAAYQHAISQSYRFFSYGDAMFLTHRVE